MPATTILTDPEDYNSIRAYLGLGRVDFTDSAIGGLTFLQGAELIMRKLVNTMSAQTNGAVPTADQIMADPPVSPATEDDKLALRIATALYVAFTFTPSSTNAINISTTVGKQTVDRGGIGVQWIEQRQVAFNDVAMYLGLITGWPEYTQNIFALSGPTSSGNDPDTVSGFWLAGKL
jgi:hypothetical protein